MSVDDLASLDGVMLLLNDSIDVVDGVTLAGFDLEDIGTWLCQLQAMRARLDALAMMATAEADSASVQSIDGLRSIASFVAHHTNRDRSAIAADRRFGSWLKTMAVFGEAARAGRLSREHVRALKECDNSRTHFALMDSQETLVEAATTCTYRDFLSVLRYWMLAFDPDGDEPKAQHEARGVSARKQFDGMVVGKLKLNPVDGDAVMNALDVEMDHLRKVDEAEAANNPKPGEQRNPEDVFVPRTETQLRADAMVNLVLRGATRPDGTSAKPLTHLNLGADLASDLYRDGHDDDPSDDDPSDDGPSDAGPSDDGPSDTGPKDAGLDEDSPNDDSPKGDGCYDEPDDCAHDGEPNKDSSNQDSSNQDSSNQDSSISNSSTAVHTALGDPSAGHQTTSPTGRRALGLRVAVGDPSHGPAPPHVPKPPHWRALDVSFFDPARRCEFVDGTPLHPDWARQILGRSRLRRLVLDGTRVVDLSTSFAPPTPGPDAAAELRAAIHNATSVPSETPARIFPGPMRRAIIGGARGQCQHWGCDAKVQWLQADHRYPHSRGGPTSFANGECQCAYHNGLKGQSLPDAVQETVQQLFSHASGGADAAPDANGDGRRAA